MSEIQQYNEYSQAEITQLTSILMKALDHRIEVEATYVIIENMTRYTYWLKAVECLIDHGLV